MEPFVVKHYSADQRPTLKGNGFDGLEIGETREEAQAFVDWVNLQLERGRDCNKFINQAVGLDCAQSTPQPPAPPADHP